MKVKFCTEVVLTNTFRYVKYGYDVISDDVTIRV